MYVPCRIRRAHLWSKGWQIRHVLRKAGIEGEISLEDNDNENPKDINDDKTEINDKDSNIKVFDKSFFNKGGRDIEGNQTAENEDKIADFESLTVDDGKEGDKDVDGNNNVDKELSKWIRVISPSAHDEKTQVFQTMEDDEEPELGLLVVPVEVPAGEEGEGEPEGGDEVHQPLPHHALAKLGRA